MFNEWLVLLRFLWMNWLAFHLMSSYLIIATSQLSIFMYDTILIFIPILACWGLHVHFLRIFHVGSFCDFFCYQYYMFISWCWMSHTLCCCFLVLLQYYLLDICPNFNSKKDFAILQKVNNHCSFFLIVKTKRTMQISSCT